MNVNSLERWMPLASLEAQVGRGIVRSVDLIENCKAFQRSILFQAFCKLCRGALEAAPLDPKAFEPSIGRCETRSESSHCVAVFYKPEFFQLEILNLV